MNQFCELFVFGILHNIETTFVVGDCEVGSTRKACKNCTCGRAEEEEKVEKLGLTLDQLNNPQSACGNVCSLICSCIIWLLKWGVISCKIVDAEGFMQKYRI